MFDLGIVDDEQIIRNGLTKGIDWSELGFNVAFTASQGRQALKYMEKKLPDVVITDIRMPGIDGISFMKIVNEKYPETKIIILSGYNDFTYAQKGIEYGAFSYILKPLKEGEIENVFKKLYKTLCNGSSSADKNEPSAPSYSPAVLKTVDYIKSNFKAKIGLKELAGRLYMNPSYLSKLFKDEMGVNLTTYIQEIRIKQAQKLLKKTNYQIIEIADMVGYPDYRYFCTIFKKTIGCTPLQYRMKHLARAF